MSDPINPQHYRFGKVELIELTEQLDFCRGNAVKYLCRAGKKDDTLQDLKKALWYTKRAIRQEEERIALEGAKQRSDAVDGLFGPTGPFGVPAGQVNPEVLDGKSS